jgi:membrane protease YdiL (CAAX protease family)
MVLSVIAICSSVAKGNEETQSLEPPLFDFATLLLVIFSVVIGIWFVRSGQGTLKRQNHIGSRISPQLAVVLCFAMFVLSGIGAWLGDSISSDSAIQSTAWMYGGAIATQIPILFLYVNLQKKPKWHHTVSTVCVTFAVFVPIALVVAAISHAILVFAGLESQSNLGHSTLEQLADTSWGFSAWVVVLCVTLGAGIVEELMYRGLILPAFNTVIGGKSPWRAIVATSVVFAVMHIGAAESSAILGLFVLSIGLCWARVKSGGILAPIVIHILFNAINIAFVYSTHL